MHSTQRRKINSALRIGQQDKTIHMTFKALESPIFFFAGNYSVPKNLSSFQRKLNTTSEIFQAEKTPTTTTVLVTNTTSNQVYLKWLSEECKFQLIHAS